MMLRWPGIFRVERFFLEERLQPLHALLHSPHGLQIFAELLLISVAKPPVQRLGVFADEINDTLIIRIAAHRR